jgi:SAM-dependent methyltransferase
MNDAAPLRVMLEGLLCAICDQATSLQLDGSFDTEIGDLVPQDSLDAKSAEQLLAEAFSPDRRRLLDFGCGMMHHRPFIERLGFHWHGVDYLDSVSLTVRDQVSTMAGDVQFYDGLTLPYTNATFDIVYAMLVFQHLHHPDITFAEIARVLRPGGRLIGQVAYLEQMQDFGTFNFTPYGLKVACRSNGLILELVYPKHDAFSFLCRRLLITLGSSDQTPFDAMLDPTGYFHRRIEQCGIAMGMSLRHINLVRLMFCTHFVFQIVKPA